MSRLDEIKARVEVATPRPWGAHGYAGLRLCDVVGDQEVVATKLEKADAEFIAHARTDIPWMAEQLEAKDAEIERLRAGFARLADYGCDYTDIEGADCLSTAPTLPDSWCPPCVAIAALSDQGGES